MVSGWNECSLKEYLDIIDYIYSMFSLERMFPKEYNCHTSNEWNGCSLFQLYYSL